MFLKRNRIAVVVLAAAFLVGGACGDDDDDVDAGAGAGTEEQASADVETYCEKTLEIETIPEPEVDFESLSPEQQKEETRKFAGGRLKELAHEIQEVAPAEIKADIDKLVASVDKVAESGDFQDFENPDTDKASDNAHAFDLENCGWESVEVTAADYSFQGIPATLETGATSFEFENSGKEPHELVLIRKNDDTNESFDQLLELPEEEGRTKTTGVGGTFASPGDNDYLVVDLEAGSYMAVCFVPVGSTGEEDEGEEPSGPPHFTEGMKTEFTVK